MSYRYRFRDVNWPEAIVGGLLIAVLASRLVDVLRSIQLATQPRGLTYTEGINAVLATRPDIWFQPVEVAPHFPTIYPLGYHALVNVLWQVSGLSPFVIMHGLGLASAVVGAVALCGLVRERTDSWHGPAAASLIYALSPAVTGATVVGRVDHLGVALGLLALLAADRRHLEWAIALTVAAMYVKHALVVFPIVIAITIWRRYTLLEAWYYASLVAVVGLGILTGLVYLTDGQAWLHLVTYNALHPWRWSVWAGQVTWFAYTHLALVGVLLYALATGRVRATSGTFAIVAAIFAFLTIGKIGSWVGYFLPLIAACAWILGEQVSMAGIEWRREARLAVAVVVIVQLGLYGAWAPNMAPEFDAEAQQRALGEIGEGPILAEDGTLYVESGVEQVHEPLMMRYIYEYDGYGGKTLAGDIRAQQFEIIVLGRSVKGWEPGDVSRWHDDELAAIEDSYALHWESGGYYVYVPVSTQGFITQQPL